MPFTAVSGDFTLSGGYFFIFFAHPDQRGDIFCLVRVCADKLEM
jgi:hypothetical protein